MNLEALPRPVGTAPGGAPATPGLTTLSPSFWKLAKLEELYLQDNNLTSIDQLMDGLANVAHMPALRQLNINGNEVSALLPALGDLTSLDGLYASGNRLTSVSGAALGSLTALESLHLDNNQLTSLPAEIGGLPLKFLVITIHRLRPSHPPATRRD